jgi:hypothetical protein
MLLKRCQELLIFGFSNLDCLSIQQNRAEAARKAAGHLNSRFINSAHPFHSRWEREGVYLAHPNRQQYRRSSY